MTTAALISTRPLWHGGEGQLAVLARGLRRRGHRVVVLARRGGLLADRLADEGFDVFSFPGRGRSPLALWQIRRALRQARPDLLYINDSHALTAAAVASLGLHIPARIAARRVDFPLRSPRQYRQGCDRVICVSRAVAEVCRAGGVDPHQIRIVHEGVEPQRVRSGDRQRGRQSLRLADAAILLLTVANLTDHKGHRFLLQAMPEVLQRFPQARLAMAGDGELAQPLRRQAEKLGIAPHVDFLGYRDDVQDLVQAADLFVLPSHMEGLCTSLIDAMFAARPIVTTTAGGIPDLLQSEQEPQPLGWLVPPRDPSALAVAIAAALASPEERAIRAERACRRAEQHFTADRMVDGTLAVYEEIRSAGAKRVA